MMFSIYLNLKTFRLLNCLHPIFLHCILRYHHLIKDKLIDLLNERLFGRISNIWLATKMYTINAIYGRVKKSVMPLFIFWINFLLDLELNFIDKLLVFRWDLIVLRLLQIFFFFFFFFFFLLYERFHEVSLT